MKAGCDKRNELGCSVTLCVTHKSILWWNVLCVNFCWPQRYLQLLLCRLTFVVRSSLETNQLFFRWEEKWLFRSKCLYVNSFQCFRGKRTREHSSRAFFVSEGEGENVSFQYNSSFAKKYDCLIISTAHLTSPKVASSDINWGSFS